MRSILITGANRNFIGCNLVRHFGEAGHQVLALDRSEPNDLIRRYLTAASDHVAFVQADLCQPDWHKALPVQSVDIVVHAAAVTNVAANEEVSRAGDAVAR